MSACRVNVEEARRGKGGTRRLSNEGLVLLRKVWINEISKDQELKSRSGVMELVFLCVCRLQKADKPQPREPHPANAE